MVVVGIDRHRQDLLHLGAHGDQKWSPSWDVTRDRRISGLNHSE